MTLDDLEQPKRTLVEKIGLWSPPENLSEDRPILSASIMYVSDSSFWKYKVCADIPWGSLERWRQKTV